MRLLAAAWVVASRSARTAASKEATVKLEISGMTRQSCADTVQDALKSVKGVKEAKVLLADNQAVVKYDPVQVKVDDLIKAVRNAKGMSCYDAKVKEK